MYARKVATNEGNVYARKVARTTQVCMQKKSKELVKKICKKVARG